VDIGCVGVTGLNAEAAYISRNERRPVVRSGTAPFSQSGGWYWMNSSSSIGLEHLEQHKAFTRSYIASKNVPRRNKSPTAMQSMRPMPRTLHGFEISAKGDVDDGGGGESGSYDGGEDA
jgi:hypothetical protein